MASSSNRFAALGEDSSSSKEQEVPVPVTGTEGMGNQTMQDTAQAGPPISSGDPEGSAARKLTLQEGVALFFKKRAQYLAEEEEHEKAKKSRESSKPSTSAIPPRGLRKRSASSDEAEEPPKRRQLEPVPSSPKPEEPATSAIKTSPDVSPSASELVAYNDSALSLWWANIRTPKMPLLCIIQVNYLARMGSFTKGTKDWAFQLNFDADLERSPTMTMDFFSQGVEGPHDARTEWCPSDYIRNEWMVTDFKINRVADCLNHRRIAHRKILTACQTDEERGRLICISLDARPTVVGHCNGRAKKHFSAMFTDRHRYHLYIWFLAPDSVETFEKLCLSFFKDHFEQRKSPDHDLQKAHEARLANHLRP